MRRASAGADVIPTVRFDRTKYGRELLVDVALLSELPGFDYSERPYALEFHDILLVTRGRGSFALDDSVHRVAPGLLLLTRPGEVRRHRVRGLDGACLFFTAEFVREVFADPGFLDQFAYFRPDRPGGALRLAPAEQRQFLRRFREMEREIGSWRNDAPHALRARLYEMLVVVNRWYVARHGAPSAAVPGDFVERFRRLVERDYSRRRRVADYARELGVSPGHLSASCRRQLGRSAGAYLRERLRLEAKRLLLYTGMTAAEVGFRLGFDDPAYFARFFRRETGEAPSAYRTPRAPRQTTGGARRRR